MGPMDRYTDQEADRLSKIMVDDPHFAADELRGQLQQLDPQTASVLIAKTKNFEYVGGLGDLQVQVEFDQNGYDSGYRNVTMTTQYGVEQIAEIQAQPPSNSGYDVNGNPSYGYGNPGYDQGYAPNPLSFSIGVIVGDLGWQRRHGMNFEDERYRGWCNREQMREDYWYRNNHDFMRNWGDSDYRSRYQNQNWFQGAYHPNEHNTYMGGGNRYDHSRINSPVNTTIINETINNTQIVNQNTYNNFRGQNVVVPRLPGSNGDRQGQWQHQGNQGGDRNHYQPGAQPVMGGRPDVHIPEQGQNNWQRLRQGQGQIEHGRDQGRDQGRRTEAQPDPRQNWQHFQQGRDQTRQRPVGDPNQAARDMQARQEQARQEALRNQQQHRVEMPPTNQGQPHAEARPDMRQRFQQQRFDGHQGDQNNAAGRQVVLTPEQLRKQQQGK